MKFSQHLRERAISLHSTPQLNRQVSVSWRDQDHFTSYLVRRQKVHVVLDPIMRTPMESLADRLSEDLLSLDVDWRHRGDTTVYLEYLQALQTTPGNRHVLVAHYYAFVLAHLAGGGVQIARSARPVLPSWFLDESLYYNNIPSPGAIMDDINMEADYWTPRQMERCLDELEVAFRFGMLMLTQA